MHLENEECARAQSVSASPLPRPCSHATALHAGALLRVAHARTRFTKQEKRMRVYTKNVHQPWPLALKYTVRVYSKSPCFLVPRMRIVDRIYK